MGSDGITCERCRGRMTEGDFDMKRRVCRQLGKPFTPPKVCGECVLLALFRFAFAFADDDTPAETWGVFCLQTARWWPRSFPSQEEAHAHYLRCRGPGTLAEVRVRPKRGVEFARPEGND